jgi:hypothetical protein
VTFAAGGDVPEPLRAKWSKTLKYIVQMQDPSRAVLSNYDRSAAESRKELEANKRPINWPLSTKFDGSGVPKMLSRRDKIALKGAAPEVDTRVEKGIPESAILIQWASLPDAQFAGEWHADVVHEEMASKYARKAEKKYKELREGEDALGEEGGPDSDRYAARGGKTMKEPEKTGWIGALNPEARRGCRALHGVEYIEHCCIHGRRDCTVFACLYAVVRSKSRHTFTLISGSMIA